MGTCKCNGAVTYGAKGKFRTKHAGGSIGCNNGVFGDPVPGTVKACYCKGGKKKAKKMAKKKAGKRLINKGVSGCTSSKKCGKCTGDCDSDKDCKTGLKCFQRNGLQHVPGCAATLGGGNIIGYDYCYGKPSGKKKAKKKAKK